MPPTSDDVIATTINQQFGLSLRVQHVVAHGLPTGHTTMAHLFLTDKGQLYAYIYGHSPQSLGDIAKQLKHMGLVPSVFVPPKADAEYFERAARDKFSLVFPGRKHISDADLRYYRQLVPYLPALVKIADVPTGIIRQFDSRDSSQWRAAVKFSYKKIDAII